MLYAVGVLCNTEWCNGQLWCSSIILCDFTSIAHSHHTNTNIILIIFESQGIVNVNVPVRSVVVNISKKSTGEKGLLVYNPVGPTKEVLSYVRDLEKKLEAPVKYVDVHLTA